ncbi:M10 family metallopeptidase, partial [Brevundimonas sp.]|uniref:M10 family metallopeptidase n=1 Tax=Brevundimonas sp. TaxID=1871086 RepID=UPI0035B1D072
MSGSYGSEGQDGAADTRPDGATTTTTSGTTSGFVLSTEPVTIPGQSVWGALKSGYVWTGNSVTFGFATGAADYYANPMYSGYNEPSQFIALSSAGKGIVRAAFSTWSEIIDLTITEAASSAHPDLNVGGSSVPSTAWAYYPGTNDSSGDVWFGLDKSFLSKLVGSAGPSLGSYEYATSLHEIGHALGLKHPHQGSATVPAAYDGLEYSVMSYRSYLGGPTSYYTVETWGFPQSLMMLDIAAIQDLYGADFTTQSGATVYSFDPLTGEMTVNGTSAGIPGANRVFRTLWDGGGSDTIDLSAYSTNLDIDLNPGKGIDLDVGGTLQRAQLSSTVYAAHHIYMSLLYNGDTRSLIENATGGTGDDILRGNLAANLLKGGAGNDTLSGGLGADTLTLGAGTDTVTDTVAGLNGDRITDFSIQDDRIVVQGATLAASQVWYDVATGLLKIDTNGDRIADATVSVNLGLTTPQILL